MRKFDMFWRSNKEWYHFEDGYFVVNDNAPEEAKKSYEHYLEQCKELDRTGE